MSKLVLYSQEISPPCRAVLMTAEAIGVNFDICEINLFNQDQLTEEFRKLNPQHTIPTLDDDGFIIWDSHAIMCYLVGKYAKDDSLYPKDLQKRARVDKMLHFDSGVLFSNLKSICRPLLLLNETSIPEEKLKNIEDAYKFLEKFLDGKEWLAGDCYTLADISCVATISSLTAFRTIDDFPNSKAWMERCEEHLPGYKKCNVPGSKQIHEAVRQKLSMGS